MRIPLDFRPQTILYDVTDFQSMPHFRHRRRLRRKEIENLADALENALGCKVFSIGDTVDTAEGGEYDIILVDGAILGMMQRRRCYVPWDSGG
jgi:predicted ribosome-associated RNA-binding protein Tma20